MVWEWCKNVWYSSDSLIDNGDFFVWEWCKNVWCSSQRQKLEWGLRFENDVKMYGTQAVSSVPTYPDGLRMM